MHSRHDIPHSLGPPPPAQQQRFSWQEPTDTGSAAAQQSGDAHTTTAPQLQTRQHHDQSADSGGRQSWIETPIEMRQGQHKWPSATLKKPSESSIPQSPAPSASPASPASPAAAPLVTALPEKAAVPPENNPYQNIQPPIATHPALASDHTSPLSSAEPTPPVSYAVPPQTAMAPLLAQSPPLTVDTRLHAQTAQNPFSPGVMAPIPLSSADPTDQQPPPHPTASSTPYTPYSNILRNGGAATPSAREQKAQPFAPDDLIATRAAAVRQSRSDTTSSFNPTITAASAHQPGQIAHPNMRTGGAGDKDSWSHSLFALAPDPATCCLGLVCPCVVHSRTSYRLDARSSGRDATDLLGFRSANATCALMALLGCVGCLFPMLLRARIRHAYHIDGGVGGDALLSCCCCCCAVVQNEREVKGREEGRRRFEGPGGGEGYRGPQREEMRYRPGGR